MKALFLYSELAGYFANCINVFQEQYEAEVYLVYVPHGPQAPFDINIPGIKLISISDLSNHELYELCISFNPDVVYVTGWSIKIYRRICKQLRKVNKPVVCGVDNVWKGSLRQHIACLISSWLVKPYFSCMWVAGHQQYQFARKLGYSHNNILTGLYAADVGIFSQAASLPLNRYIVYVGRFEEIKGVDRLYEAFSSLTNEERNGWKLKMIGNGALKAKFADSESIEIYPFMQPKALIKFVSDAGGFILPSHHEPWGVVVHEFAAAGKPMLLSNQVCSAEDYLIHNYNGFKFSHDNVADLKATLIQFISLSDLERERMGQRSAKLANLNSPTIWAAKLASINYISDVI